MNQDKKNVFTILAINLVMFSGLFLFCYAYDPLQIFHKTFRSQMRVHYNMRQQAAGIINNYEFDSIIFGTSLLENTSSVEASKVLGGNFVNISMSASDFFERSHVLDYLMTKKNIKKVVYSLDDNFFEKRQGHPEYSFDTFNYLYDENPFNDIKVYLNTEYLVKCLVKEVINHPTLDFCIGKVTTLDRPAAWHTDPQHQARFGGLKSWFAADNNSQIIEVFKELTTKVLDKGPVRVINADEINHELESIKTYLKKYVIDISKKYKDTEFHFVFPPYSRAKFALWAKYEPEKFEIYKEVIEYLAAFSTQNIHFYGFEEMDFLDDIANYKDLNHYHQRYNSQMLSWIKERKGELKSDNVQNYLIKIQDKADKFDLKNLTREIKSYLDKIEKDHTKV